MATNGTNGHTVLVLGGGIGGVVAAHRLRKRLPARHRVVLVEREALHVFQPSLLWVTAGTRTPERISRPLDALTRKGIEVIMGEITAVEPVRHIARVNDRQLEADAVVIALGADLAPETIPGLTAGGHNLYTVSGASAAREALQRLEGGRVVVLTAAPAYKCPAAPYEAAMLVNAALRRRLGDRAQVAMYAAEPGPMATAGPEVSSAVRGMVEGEGVTYHPEHQVTVVDPAARRLTFSNGATATYDLLLYVPPHRAPSVIRNAGLAPANGWMAVDPHTLATGTPGVFAIGDVTGIPIPSGKMLPKAGVFAHRQAEVVADNLVAEWTGRAPTESFDGTGSCFIETGNGRAGYGAGNFYADPLPTMRLHTPAPWWHWGKVLYEKRWLRKWF